MDKLIRGLIADNSVAVYAISGKQMVQKAAKVHGLSRVCTAALGRTLLQCAMMSTQLKNPADRLTAILAGGGMAGNIVCTTRSGGIVKGYIENPSLELPLNPKGKLDVALAVGWFGDLTVARDLAMKEPYVGKTKIVSGEIAEDFANYYVQSEQQPCLDYLGVRLKPESGEVLSAGGLMLCPLPFCPDSVLDSLTEMAKEFAAMSEALESMELEAYLNKTFLDLGLVITEQYTPEFICDCSRERVEKALIALGKEELTDMAITDKGASLHCEFCNTDYRFSEEELMLLVKEFDNE